MSKLHPITSIYFDPTTDYGFKKLFGTEANKDLLMDFLNSMLPPQHQIVSLSFQKTEQLPEHGDERRAIYDIFCHDITGESFIVEMQKSRMTHFMDRTIYYGTFPIQLQAPKGKWDFDLKRVYLIGVLDFEYDSKKTYWKRRQLLRSFSLRDDRGVLMSDKLHFKFLQLPFFKKKKHQLKTQFDKWCYFLKNLENFNSIPDILNEPIFMKAFDVAELSQMEKAEWMLYQISKSKKYDMELLADEAEERGMEKGIEKTQIKIVIAAHKKGHSIIQISDFTDIPLERVSWIVLKYEEQLEAKLIDETAEMLLDTEGV